MPTKQKPQRKPEQPKPKVRHRNQVRKSPTGAMQLVLAEDVPNLGKQGDVVEVKPGYGRNYLLPNGLATIPTEHNLRQVERYKERVRQAREAKIADLKVLAEQIQRIAVTIEAAANEEGHLYGSVGPREISKALKAKILASGLSVSELVSTAWASASTFPTNRGCSSQAWRKPSTAASVVCWVVI